MYQTNYRQRKHDPKQRQLTGSLVFDEEQLKALLESVLIHIKLDLHPKRGMERWAETEREIKIRSKRKTRKSTEVALQVTEEMKYFFCGVKSRDKREKWRAWR